jgi:hypothetical protein
MSKYSWDFDVPEYFLQIQEALNTLAASATAISKTWEAAVSKYDYSGVHTALNACLENYRSISIQMSSVAKSILPLIDTSVYDTLKASTAMTKALQSVDWSWVISAYAEAFGDAEVEDNNATQNAIPEEVPQEIRIEIASDISQVLSKPEEIHAVSKSKYLQWKERNPGFASLFLEILYPFLLMLIPLLFSVWQARPVKDSQVYQEPVSTSNVVYNLTVENTVTVVGDVPYYYEVEFVNPETGEQVIGYIYKGNLTEVVSDAPEDVEASEATPDTAESQRETTE